MVTRTLLFWQGLEALWTASQTELFKKLTFWQTAVALATGRYEIAVKAATAMTWLYVSAQTALVVWSERAVFWLTAVTLSTRIAGASFFSAAVMAGVLATALQALSLLGVIVIGVELVLHEKQVSNWLAKHVPGGGWLDYQLKNKQLARDVRWFAHPHFAGGGVMDGTAWVGEHGPELLHLPAGSRITPTGYTPSGTYAGASNRPIIVQVMLDRKVLAEAVAHEFADAGARA
jgi:hypothetical protein